MQSNAETIANDERRNWDERIRAAAEIIWKEDEEKKLEKVFREGNGRNIRIS